MKKILYTIMLSFGVIGTFCCEVKSDVIPDEDALRLSPLVEQCARVMCPDNTDSCFEQCREKVNQAYAHGKEIGMNFLDVMDDCQDFTCPGDMQCLNGKINAFLLVKKGAPAPCYGGG